MTATEAERSRCASTGVSGRVPLGRRDLRVSDRGRRATTDGRGTSIWDTFSHTPGKVRGGDTGDIACDFYHRADSDLDLLERDGPERVPLLVAWPRIQPSGQRRGQPARDSTSTARSPTALREREHHARDHALPLGPAAGARGRGRLGAARHGAALRGVRDDRRRRRSPTPARSGSTINEPQVVAHQGYRIGTHAPGRMRRRARRGGHPPPARSGTGSRCERCARRSRRTRAVGISLDIHPMRPWGEGAEEAVRVSRRRGEPDLPRAGPARPLSGGRTGAYAAAARADRATATWS